MHRHVHSRHHVLQRGTVLGNLDSQAIQDLCLGPLTFTGSQSTREVATGDGPRQVVIEIDAEQCLVLR